MNYNKEFKKVFKEMKQEALLMLDEFGEYWCGLYQCYPLTEDELTSALNIATERILIYGGCDLQRILQDAHWLKFGSCR